MVSTAPPPAYILLCVLLYVYMLCYVICVYYYILLVYMLYSFWLLYFIRRLLQPHVLREFWPLAGAEQPAKTTIYAMILGVRV